MPPYHTELPQMALFLYFSGIIDCYHAIDLFITLEKRLASIRIQCATSAAVSHILGESEAVSKELDCHI